MGKRIQYRGHLAPAKKKNSRCPDLRGMIEIDGTYYWLSAWNGENVYGLGRLNIVATPRGPDGKPLEEG